MTAKVTVTGRLVRDVEFTSLKDFDSAKGTLAYNENKDKAHFINFQVTGPTAKVLKTFTGKGCRLVLHGDLVSYEYNDKTNWYVKAKDIDIIDFVDKVEQSAKPKTEEYDRANSTQTYYGR